MLGITGADLVSEDETEYLSLFDTAETPTVKRGERIEHALDEIRGKYGKSAVTRAAVMKKDLGIGEESKWNHTGKNCILTQKHAVRM
jgi:DNA polymerase-4